MTIKCLHFQKFRALGDFHTSNQSEMSFREGDIIEVLRAGSNGWWFAKHTASNKEGWAPANYLEPLPRSNSQYSVSSIGNIIYINNYLALKWSISVPSVYLYVQSTYQNYYCYSTFHFSTRYGIQLS